MTIGFANASPSGPKSHAVPGMMGWFPGGRFSAGTAVMYTSRARAPSGIVTLTPFASWTVPPAAPTRAPAPFSMTKLTGSIDPATRWT